MRRNMADMEIIEVTSNAITVKLGPDDVRAISNSLNEMCNGIGWDALNEWDFHARLGVFRWEARAVLRELNRAVRVMKEKRRAGGKDW